ncbi:AAA family ATPase [Pseudomonas lutea]|uniref:AAA family ATPase n=1 Tax=Pseudomonas lutea TaxID=243924 RepID=A0ABR9A357_9PSED|nr:AAA family ATPase [Pseudomonas lutea]MBD8120340.1 AAA family ATPase [Pseudomonas lutea]
MDINFVVGKNGSGKSRYLQKAALETDRHTILICNTVHDRYRASSNVKKLSIRNYNSKPSNVIKAAYIKLAREAGYRLNIIAKVLEYCNYAPYVSFEIIPSADFEEQLTRFKELNAASGIDLGLASTIIDSLQEIPEFGRDTFHINLSDDYISPLIQETLLGFLENERALKRFKLLKSINVSVKPKGRRHFVRIEDASSGELTLIASQIFILMNIQENSLVLIDEPENSLHPQWQKDYVNQLGDLIGRYSPQVMIATHSPLIVSGVRNSEDVIQFHYAETGDTTSPVRDVPSAEESLWEQFETITPESRYVSDRIVDLLEDLDNKSKSFDEVTKVLNEMEEASYDYRQEKVLRAAKALAVKMHSGSQND